MFFSRRETAGGTQGASVSFRQSSRQVHTKEHIQIKAPIVESLSVVRYFYLSRKPTKIRNDIDDN